MVEHYIPLDDDGSETKRSAMRKEFYVSVFDFCLLLLQLKSDVCPAFLRSITIRQGKSGNLPSRRCCLLKLPMPSLS